jgi:polygalacturonase
VTVDTAAIQRAIEAAARAGGGARVLVPSGHRFLTGTLELRGNMDFHLDGGLVISTNQTDYRGDGVLTALNAENLRITGSGKIEGRSLEFMTDYDKAGEWWLFKEWRPKLFVLAGCTNLEVRDITFGDAPFWGLHMLGCKKVLVDHVTVRNRLDVPNCDGIDPDHCQDVEIRNCDIICGDDAVVLKTTRQTSDFGPCANIYVHDCVFKTQDSGLKIGTETTGDIHDIRFERCKILTGSRGLTIQLRDEGNVYNVAFRDIKFTARYYSDPWWGRGEAISFTAIPRLNTTVLGCISNIVVQDVVGRAENSIRVNGSPKSRIQDVHFENVAVTLDRWTKYKGGLFDNRPTRVLDPIETHGNPGFSIRYADNVTLDNCSVRWGGNCPDYFTYALEAEKVTGLRLTGFEGKAAHPERDAATFIH